MSPRHHWTIADLRAMAKRHGGRCLAKSYAGLLASYTWECAEGHRFRAIGNVVAKKGGWCLVCSGKRPHSIESLRALAAERGGACLSKLYIDVDTKLAWRCARHHVWQSRPYSVLKGAWCPECTGSPRLPAEKMLERMRRLAEERGGRCLATEYTKAKHLYMWECAKRHRWEQTWDIVHGGAWCPLCVGRLPPDQALSQLRKLARARGGKCLSDEYVPSPGKMKWQCRAGHRWEAPAASIRGGSWCARCAGITPVTIDQMHAVARERGGACLSKTVSNSKDKLRWRCAEGHVWSAAAANVKNNGTWCPKCATSPRYTLADMQAVASRRGGRCVSKRFVIMNHHLVWECASGHTWRAKAAQVATTGTWCPVCWGRQRGTLAEMRELARENGGQCLSTEYVNNQTKLRWRCAEGHEWMAAPVSLKLGHWCPFCRRRGIKGIGDYLLAEHVRVARERGGECLSKRYVDAQQPLRWRCQLGHEWTASSGAVVSGSWCPKCAHTRRPELEEFQRIAREHRGVCLSTDYVNATTPLLFQCRHGHRFESRPYRLRKGGWCPRCARSRPRGRAPPETLTLEAMQAIAEERGGECLSDEYINAKIPLTWRCGVGHEWESKPSMVLKGSWCPVCSGRAPLTMKDMHAAAALRGGKCLSKIYRGSAVKLEWECGNRHRWRATPNAVRGGSWCPKCLEKAPDFGIARMCELARKRGGVCLSAQHRSPHKALRWRCAQGHVWRAHEADVVAGKWCPRCPA